LTLQKGKLHIITGEIGSGKSPFLSLILNELVQISGEMKIDLKPIGLCSQDAWITHDSIRNNILNNLPFEQSK